jgi:uncharacterized protein
MTEPVARMVPMLDALNREFWTAGEHGELRVTRCTACRHWTFPLSRRCPECGSATEYDTTTGRGTVFTYTTNAHPYNPAVPLPYNISIVELRDQTNLRFTTNVVGCSPESVHIDMPVRVVFEQHGEVFVPLFVPDSDPGGS